MYWVERFICHIIVIDKWKCVLKRAREVSQEELVGDMEGGILVPPNKTLGYRPLCCYLRRAANRVLCLLHTTKVHV